MSSAKIAYSSRIRRTPVFDGLCWESRAAWKVIVTLGPGIREDERKEWLRASERPGVGQVPVLLPAGQATAAELERDAHFGRVETRNAGVVDGIEHFIASAAGVIDERPSERRRRLVGRHAVGERERVGAWRAAPG